MVGRRIGRLTVTARAPQRPQSGKRAVWRCRCVCGNVVDVVGKSLRQLHATQSSGCLKNEMARRRLRTHGMTQTREYRAWAAAKTRCFNQKTRSYRDYGGRGITMCERWCVSFEAFLADMGPCPTGYTIERNDHNGHYEPDNCRWATYLEQANNTRQNHVLEVEGERRTIAEWERHLGFASGTLKRRILLGWSIQRAICEPERYARPSRGPIQWRGETLPVAEWARRTGIPATAIHARLTRHGWSVERALTMPVRHR